MNDRGGYPGLRVGEPPTAPTIARVDLAAVCGGDVGARRPHRRAGGPAWIALHGFLGNSEQWRRVFALARRPYAVKYADLPGHVDSPPPRAGGVFENCVAEYAATLDVPRGAWLAGYSMGARIALAMLCADPTRFGGAVLVGVQAGLESDDERAARAAWDAACASDITQKGLAAFVAHWEALPMFETQRRLPADVLERQRRARCEHVPAHVAAAMRSFGLGAMPNFRSALCNLTVPVVVVVGSRDEKFIAAAHALKNACASARVVIVSGAGHNVALEAPGELAAIVDSVAVEDVNQPYGESR